MKPTFTNNLKIVGKIKKDIFNQLITGILHKEYKMYGIVDMEHCNKCKEESNKDCLTCTDRKYKICNKYDEGAVLINDKTEIVSIIKTLSKKEILVYLYYHFCNISNEGNIAVVSESDMARTINCSLTTIYNVNKTLRSLSLIEFDRIGKGLISVSINNYDETFKNQAVKRVDKNNNNLKIYNGYITLTLNWFKELIKNSKTTNTLRVALYKTIKFDSYKVRNLNKKEYKVKVFFREYKAILSGKLCNKEVQALINNIKNLFIDELEMEAVNTFSLKDDFIAKKVTDRYRKYCNKQMGKVLGSLNKEHKEDLYSLSIQYGVSSIVEIIKKLLSSGETIDSLKDNFGMIVSAIKENIEELLATRVKKSIFNNKEAFML